MGRSGGVIGVRATLSVCNADAENFDDFYGCDPSDTTSTYDDAYACGADTSLTQPTDDNVCICDPDLLELTVLRKTVDLLQPPAPALTV